MSRAHEQARAGIDVMTALSVSALTQLASEAAQQTPRVGASGDRIIEITRQAERLIELAVRGEQSSTSRTLLEFHISVTAFESRSSVTIGIDSYTLAAAPPGDTAGAVISAFDTYSAFVSVLSAAIRAHDANARITPRGAISEIPPAPASDAAAPGVGSRPPIPSAPWSAASDIPAVPPPPAAAPRLPVPTRVPVPPTGGLLPPPPAPPVVTGSAPVQPVEVAPRVPAPARVPVPPTGGLLPPPPAPPAHAQSVPPASAPVPVVPPPPVSAAVPPPPPGVAAAFPPPSVATSPLPPPPPPGAASAFPPPPPPPGAASAFPPPPPPPPGQGAVAPTTGPTPEISTASITTAPPATAPPAPSRADTAPNIGRHASPPGEAEAEPYAGLVGQPHAAEFGEGVLPDGHQIPEPRAPKPPTGPVVAVPVVSEPVVTLALEPDDLDDIDMTRISESSHRAAKLVLTGKDGDSYEVTEGTYVLGRKPDVRSHGAARPLAIKDPTRTVSKSHAVIECSSGRLILTDVGSTNGSRILSSDGVSALVEAEPNTPLDIPQDTDFQIGDLTFTWHMA